MTRPLALFTAVRTLVLRERRVGVTPDCRSCDYNLTGNVSGVCPECGLEITKPEATR